MSVALKQTSSSLLDGLNPRQREAIEETVNESALVIAGAGSGKTGVLTKRIAYLMLECAVPANNIMAVTFTSKAAREMRERVEKLVGADAKGLTIGTFHGICLQILKKFGKNIGYENFGIADEDDSKAIMKQAILKVEGACDAKGLRLIRAQISDLKNSGITVKKHRENLLKAGKDPSHFSVHEIYKEYEEGLKKNNLLDFDDLLLKTLQLLEFDAMVRAHYQKRYHYIMCDEFQDTNDVQYSILQLLKGSKNNLFVVGDVDQGIYSWRGADIGIILSFQQDYPDAKIIRLEQNYRSTQTIVAAGNAIVKNNSRRIEKNAFTMNDVGSKIKVAQLNSDVDEAKFIKDEIQNLVKFAGRKYGDFAVLYRSNAMSQVIEKELVNGRIPYVIVGHVGFYERMEIKDTLAYLRVVANPKDDIAMKRVLGLHPGIGKKTVEEIEKLADADKVSILEALKRYVPRKPQTKAAIDDLRDMLQKLYLVYRVAEQDTSPKAVESMLEIVWRRTNYIERLREDGSPEAKDRIENLKELLKVARVYQEEAAQPNIREFLEEISLASDTGKNKKEADCVKLMTLHASKGLEFPVVFIVGLEEGVFPSRMSSNVEEQLEEERRLMYVGVTRAEEELYLTHAKQRRTYRGIERNEPSRFLEEIPPHLIEQV
jgi:DNA helicase-2/ATP-dependent DNA helicase PcrA